MDRSMKLIAVGILFNVSFPFIFFTFFGKFVKPAFILNHCTYALMVLSSTVIPFCTAWVLYETIMLKRERSRKKDEKTDLQT